VLRKEGMWRCARSCSALALVLIRTLGLDSGLGLDSDAPSLRSVTAAASREGAMLKNAKLRERVIGSRVP
jgi:hypothetical protein